VPPPVVPEAVPSGPEGRRGGGRAGRGAMDGRRRLPVPAGGSVRGIGVLRGGRGGAPGWGDSAEEEGGTEGEGG